MHHARVPRTIRRVGSYRIQLRQGMTFEGVTRLAGYLQALGISHGYLSPPFLARPGSTHGYDVCDPTRFDPSLGDEEAFERMAAALAASGIQLILDIVPNHMAADADANPRWRDVLASGQAARDAATFDIDWTAPARPELQGRILLPILDRPYGEAVRAGRIVPEPDAAVLRVGTVPLPLQAASVAEARAATVTPETLHQLLERQPYRLAHWRVANDDINYRRFFNIDHLVGVRVDDPVVFADTHTLIRRLVENGLVSGLRVDHIDGLADPRAYLARVNAWDWPADPFVLVEKILAPAEELRSDWYTAGTTGYEFLNAVTRLFVPRRERTRLESIYRRFVGRRRSFQAVSRSSRSFVLDRSFHADVDAMTERLLRVAEESWDTRDLTRHGLRRAVGLILGALEVYRTYVTPSGPGPEDEAVIQGACAHAAEAGIWVAELAFVRDLLLWPTTASRWAIARRFQQLSSALFAKAVEDTAFYRDNTLLALNEVGGQPSRSDSPTRAFHELNARRARGRPGLSATATHDTKLGEDARLRLAVLAAHPDEWDQLLARCHQRGRGTGAPSRQDQYRCYQALVAAWPPEAVAGRMPDGFQERLQEYLVKSAREAKQRTDWERPNEAYEGALSAFVKDLLADPEFLAHFRPFITRIGRATVVLSLAQLVLKLASPGMPDFYQGTEVWDHHLVDPDNRRPPDFAALATILTELDRDTARGRRQALDRWLEQWFDGRIKLFVMREGLLARQRDPDLFERGSYRVLGSASSSSNPTTAFVRSYGGRSAVAVVTRRVNAPSPGDLVLPRALRPGTYRDVFTHQELALVPGGTLSVSAVLAGCPVALLLGPVEVTA